MAFVPSDFANRAIATALKLHIVSGSVDGPFYGASAALYQNDLHPAHDTPLGSLTEADFTDYARKAITWGSVYETPNSSYGLPDGLLQWQPTHTVTTSNLIYGWYCVDGSGNYLGAERFAVPIAVNSEDSAILLVPLVEIPAGFDDSMVSS
jgi:hypothetical protein